MSRAAVIQINSQENIPQNLHVIAELCEQAKKDGAELIVLPEMFALIGEDVTARAALREIAAMNALQDFVQDLARQLQVWLVAGTLPVPSHTANPFAASLIIDHNGKVQGQYNKIHMFDVNVPGSRSYQESAAWQPGNHVSVIDTPIGRCGVAVCFDLRFPEMFREMVRQGAEVFAVPAAFTAATGPLHYELLLKARAVENLCYVLGSNQCGQHSPNRASYGHSMIISPWGETLAKLDNEPSYLVYELDLTALHDLRAKFPVLKHL